MKKILTFFLYKIFIVLISVNSYAEQTPMFSQFYVSSLYLNPALCGFESKLVISGIHRTQWAGLNPYHTNSVSLIIPLHGKEENSAHFGGIGLNFYNASAGNINGGNANITGFSLSGAYNIKINTTIPQTLTFGLQLGAIQFTTNLSNARFGSQYDINFDNSYNPTTGTDPLLGGNTSLNKIVPDVSAGLLYYYNAGRNIYAPGIGFYLGLAFSNLSSPNISVVKEQTYALPLILKLHTGFEIHLAKMLNMSPNLLYFVQGKNSLVSAGANFTYLLTDHDEYFKPTRIVFGSGYRFGDAIIFMIGFGSKSYNVGLSYDYYTSSLRNVLNFTGNAYEISFKSTLNIGKRAKKSSKFHTPLM